MGKEKERKKDAPEMVEELGTGEEGKRLKSGEEGRRARERPKEEKDGSRRRRRRGGIKPTGDGRGRTGSLSAYV